MPLDPHTDQSPLTTGRIGRLAATGLDAGHGTNDDCRGTSDARTHRDRFAGTVLGAGTALHASVAVEDARFLVLDLEDGVRTDDGAHAASVALVDIQRQCDHPRQISQPEHDCFRKLSQQTWSHKPPRNPQDRTPEGTHNLDGRGKPDFQPNTRQ